jgi:hypothetical protein
MSGRLPAERRALRALIVIALIAVGSCAIAAGSVSAVATMSRAASLPPISFPAGSGVSRTSKPEVEASGRTFLGYTELLTFSSTMGKCVEVDHVPQRSRAGACGVVPVPSQRPLAITAEGYSNGPGKQGVSEIIGTTVGSASRVFVEYRLERWHRTIALLGMRSLGGSGEAGQRRWFTSNIPGCQTRSTLRLRAVDQRGRRLGTVRGESQRAACREGEGYSGRAALLFGALPDH